jgi:hypothetical protein
LLVLRSVGGASGSSLAGALLASGLSAVQHAVGSDASIAAGTVHGSHFGTVYAVAAACTAISFIVALWMPNTRLRETIQVAPATE